VIGLPATFTGEVEMIEHRSAGSEHRLRRRRLAAVALTLALLSTAAGCSEENPTPESIDTGTAAASATPTESPSPSGAPTLPPEAEGTSKQAAVAFVEHWVQTLNHAMATGETTALKRLGARDCAVCRIVSERVDQVARADGALRGSGWHLQELQYLADQPPKAPVLRAVIRIAPQIVIERRGAKPDRFDGGRVLYTFHLRVDGGSWVVSELVRAT
jgi:Family of unknown function (DUF6318)